MKAMHVLVGASVLLLLLALAPAAVDAKRAAVEEEDEFADEFVEEAPVVVEEIPVEKKADKKKADAEAGDDEFSEETEGAEGTLDLKPARARGPVPIDFSNYTMEVFLLAGLIAYALNYMVGSGKNSSIAKQWQDANLEYLQEQFAQVGNGKTGDVMIHESANEFCLYGTGRRYCANMTSDLVLSKRHCLYGLVNEMVTPLGDILNYNIELTQMEPFVIVVCQKKLERRLRLEHEDVKYLAASHTGDMFGLPESLTILTDAPEVLSSVLKPEVVNIIKAQEKSFHYIHITDQRFFYKIRENVADLGLKEVPAPHKIIKAVFSAGVTEEAIKEQACFTKLCCTLIDLVARAQLSAPTRARTEKKRTGFVEVLAKHIAKVKETEAQEKREKKKWDEKAAMKEKGGEALAKYEDREAKKAQRKKMKSGKVMMARM